MKISRLLAAAAAIFCLSSCATAPVNAVGRYLPDRAVEISKTAGTKLAVKAKGRYLPDWAAEPSKTVGSSCTWPKGTKLNMPPVDMWRNPAGRKAEWEFVTKEWLYWLTHQKPWVAYRVHPEDMLFKFSAPRMLDRIYVCKGLEGDALKMVLVHEFAHKDSGYVDHYGERQMTPAQFAKAYAARVR